MSKVKYTKPPKDEWDVRTNNIRPRKIETIPFAKELKRILPYNNNLSCLEIGAIPGSFLIYLNKEFGYEITGIDFSKNTNKFYENMNANDVSEFNFIKADFFKHSFKKKFDIVCSFGFIEHFDDVKDVVNRHCKLVADKGYLVIEVPNFRNLQYIYHYIFDKSNLKIHNTTAMKPRYIDKIVTNNGFEKVFSEYVGGVEIWNDDEPRREFLKKINNKLKPIVNSKKDKVKDSRFYSPMLLMIYKKTDF